MADRIFALLRGSFWFERNQDYAWGWGWTNTIILIPCLFRGELILLDEERKKVTFLFILGCFIVEEAFISFFADHTA